MPQVSWNQPWKSIIRQLQPDNDDTSRIDSAISSVRNVLKSNWTGSGDVSKVYVAGSYAKATHTKGNLEVDLIVYLEEDDDVYREDSMKTFAETISSMWNLGGSVRTTAHSVQFKHPSTRVDIDLCFTFHLDDNGAYSVFEDQAKHGRKRKKGFDLTDADILRDSSASVSAGQVNLVRAFCQRHPVAKNAIMLSKGLKHRFFDPTETYMPSYIFEILVMYHWKEGMTYDQILRKVFESVRDLGTRRVIFMSQAKERHRPHVEHYWNSRQSRGALVMDPVNPFMNVASRVDAKDLARRSVSVLQALNL